MAKEGRGKKVEGWKEEERVVAVTVVGTTGTQLLEMVAVVHLQAILQVRVAHQVQQTQVAAGVVQGILEPLRVYQAVLAQL